MDTIHNAGTYVIQQDVQRDNGSWAYYRMGEGGSPVGPGTFWRDATPAGPDFDYDDYGYDDPNAHYGSGRGGNDFTYGDSWSTPSITYEIDDISGFY